MDVLLQVLVLPVELLGGDPEGLEGGVLANDGVVVSQLLVVGLVVGEGCLGLVSEGGVGLSEGLEEEGTVLLQ